jgi:hypothetical protein
MLKSDFRQVEYRSSIDQISQTTTTDGRDIVNSINTELILPLRLSAANPVSNVISVGPISVTNPATGRIRTITPILNLIPEFTGTTITFPGTSGEDIEIAGGSTYTLTLTDGYYIKYSICLNSVGQIILTAGTEEDNEDGATLPAFQNDMFNIGYVVLHNDGGVIQNITAGNIFQYIGTNYIKSAGFIDPRKRYIGTTLQGCPYQTFDAAYDVAQDGDTLVFMPGTYTITTTYTISKQVNVELGAGVIFDGYNGATKGISVNYDDIFINCEGALFKRFADSGDYAIYVESGADRCKIQNGRFTENDGDIYLQADTTVVDCIGY